MSIQYKIAKSSLRYFSILCSFSISFNWEEFTEGDAYLLKVSGFPLLIWYFQELCTFATIPAFALNLHLSWDSRIEKREISQLMLNLFFLIVFPFCYALQFMFIYHREEMVTLINQVIKLMRHFEQNYIPRKNLDKDRNFRHVILSLLVFTYPCQLGILYMGLFTLHPDEGRYLSSYLLRPYYIQSETKVPAFVVGFLFEFWFISTQWAGMTLQIYMNLLYLQTMATSLKGLRHIITSTSRNGTDKSMRRILRAYRKLRILSSMYNETIGQQFLSRFKSACAISCVASAFFFVKLLSMGDIMITGLSVGCFFLYVVTFTVLTWFCSNVNEESIKLKGYLRAQQTPGRTMNKEMKCYRIIGVKIGSFFVVKRITPLTMLAMISNTTMSMLISVNFSF